MFGQSYFQLISPLIFLVFSLGFALLWHYARYIRALRLFSLSYFLGACAMMGDFLRNAMDPVVAIYVINPLYVATSVTFCAGLFTFYRGGVPWRALTAQSAVILLALSWFKFVQEDIVIRTMVMNAGAAVMLGYAAIELRRDMRRLVDRILQAIVLIYSFHMILRTLVVLWYEHQTLTEANYADSIAALSLYFALSTAALALGVDGEAKNWVPDHDAVLWSTPVLPPGEQHVLQFTAPVEPGIYPYVCTYPGHGFLMYGAMYVGVSMPELATDQHVPELARQGKAAQKQFHAWGHKRPLMYRIFMPDASPAAIAVGLKHGQNYCWDAGQCRLRYAWYGEIGRAHV